MSLCTRVIARLDYKPSLGVVKGIRMDGLRRVGDLADLARRYEAQGADELLLIDVTASLMGRAPDLAGIHALEIFLPMAAGGGVTDVAAFLALCKAARGQVALCTAALQDPNLIGACAVACGAQAVIVEVQTKLQPDGRWMAYSLGGREPSGREAIEWCQEAVDRGAGELLITSVDRDGTRRGYDLEFLSKLRPRVSVPIVASGGAGHPRHCVEAIEAGASAVALGAALHTGLTILEVKLALAGAGLEVRL